MYNWLHSFDDEDGDWQEYIDKVLTSLKQD